MTSPPPDGALEAPDVSVAASESLPPTDETDEIEADDTNDEVGDLEVEADDTNEGAQDTEALPDVTDHVEYEDDALAADATESQPDTPVAADVEAAATPLPPFDCNAPSGPEDVVHPGDFLAMSQTDLDLFSGFSRIQGSLVREVGRGPCPHCAARGLPMYPPRTPRATPKTGLERR